MGQCYRTPLYGTGMAGQAVVIVLFVLVAGGAAFLWWWVAEQRKKRLAAIAATIGFRFAPDDPFGLDQLPFALFRKGDGRGWKNVMWGEEEGLRLLACDYWYFERRSDSQGGSSRAYYRFSCAVTDLPFTSPHTTIAPENVLTRLADMVGFDDIAFESEEFNRCMQVTSRDRRFANYLIDARMMDWLLAARGWSFELHGDKLLCYVRRLTPDQIPEILRATHGFHAAIPRVVVDTYGGAR